MAHPCEVAERRVGGGGGAGLCLAHTRSTSHVQVHWVQQEHESQSCLQV